MDFLQNKADKAKISSFNGSKSGFYSTADWESFNEFIQYYRKNGKKLVDDKGKNVFTKDD